MLACKYQNVEYWVRRMELNQLTMGRHLQDEAAEGSGTVSISSPVIHLKSSRCPFQTSKWEDLSNPAAASETPTLRFRFVIVQIPCICFSVSCCSSASSDARPQFHNSSLAPLCPSSWQVTPWATSTFWNGLASTADSRAPGLAEASSRLRLPTPRGTNILLYIVSQPLLFANTRRVKREQPA